MMDPNNGPWNFATGRLALSWVPYGNMFVVGAFVLACVVAAIIVFGLTYYRKWGYLWREWLTSLDHTKIGIMYIVIAVVMMLRAFVEAIMMRSQQFMAAGPHSQGFLDAAHGYLPPYHFAQLYTTHGPIMIFLGITPLITGLMNILVPLQIGARDMAYPYLNLIGLYLTAAGAALMMMSLFLGDFSKAGWIALTPLTELPYSPAVGVDYWIWVIQITGIGTTLAAINLTATIVKMRAKGMSWLRMPMFTWTAFSTAILMLTAFPVLTAAAGLLALDRYLGTHLFTPGHGGNLMLYKNLFWIWGHPEVYIMILPGWGVISEIVANFSRKPLFGYLTMVIATFAISGISWTVWLHHFFVMGQSPEVNAFFAISSMMVGGPTGVKVFNWVFTMYRGRLHFYTPMMWAFSAVLLLPIGGLTGMMFAMIPTDFELHNSVFLVSHFHNMVFVIVFAFIGGIVYWFPKIFGFRLDERYGKLMFWFWTIGTILVFVSMYLLGLMGLTRRMDYVPRAALAPLLAVEEAGMAFYCVAVLLQFVQIYVSIRDRAKYRAGADPWDARTLEWMTHSPVPHYNFAVQPVVHSRDELNWRKEHGLADQRPREYVDIHMPKNTCGPFWIGVCSFLFGAAAVWRIWWLAAFMALALIMIVILRSFVEDIEYTIPAAEVERMEKEMYANEPAFEPIEKAPDQPGLARLRQGQGS